MITQDAFARGENLIETILQKMAVLKVKRQKALIEILLMFLSFRGRMNFQQMGRQCEMNEKSYRHHFEKHFDWLNFNSLIVASTCSNKLAIGFDPSYISKSGKKTPGLGYYYSGAASKYKKGLEIGSLAVLDVNQNTAYHLESVTTTSDVSKRTENGQGITLVDHYAQTILERKGELLKLSSIMVVDGYFAKRKFVDAIVEQGQMEVICRLRDDANLNYIYRGKQSTGRGRPKKYDGKMDSKKIDKRRAKLMERTKEYHLYEIEVYSVGLKRKIKLCYVEFLKENGEVRTIKLLFSTNLNRSAKEIFQYYKTRFQMEFLFRDGKQYTGLENCQARSENKLNFHFNASLTSLNVAKNILRHKMVKNQISTYSINDLKIKFQNRNIIYRIFSIYGLETEMNKINKKVNEVFNFGSIAA